MDKQKKNSPQLRFPGFEGEWEKDEFANLVEKSSEKYDPVKDYTLYPCIELESISQETGVLLTTFNSTETKSIKTKFYKGEILFGKLRPYLKKFYKAPFDGVCSSEIWVLRGKNIYNEFLYCLIQGERYINASNISSGSKMPRADWDYISSITFCFPPLPEQHRIVAAIEDRWNGPDHRYFKVTGKDGAQYIIRNDLNTQLWELVYYRHPDTPEDGFH